MLNTPARKRFVLVCIPALIALVLPLLACGAGRAIPECQNSSSQDACSECCAEHQSGGTTGSTFNSFSDPPCRCL